MRERERIHRLIVSTIKMTYLLDDHGVSAIGVCLLVIYKRAMRTKQNETNLDGEKLDDDND